METFYLFMSNCLISDVSHCYSLGGEQVLCACKAKYTSFFSSNQKTSAYISRMEQEKNCSFCALVTPAAAATVAAVDDDFTGAAVVTIDVHEAKHLVDSGSYRFLDVRTTEEFNKGHPDVNNPLNIPYLFITPQGRVKNPHFLEQILSTFNKDDHIILGCQSGVRSLNASVDLLSADFKHVKNMGGGYAEWVKHELVIKRPEVDE